jgi:ribonuclease HI
MCELTAIFLALNWIQDFKPLNTVIFVDSLSALQAVRL